MTKYDDASWHFNGEFPSDLPKENGATHIGYFLAWCIDNKLLSDFQKEEFPNEVNQVLNRQITGRDFVLNYCDGQLIDEDLNQIGNEFAADYYEDNGEFATRVASYLKDFTVAAELYFQEFKLTFTSAYHVEDSWEFYDAFRTLIDMRFSQWKEFRKLE